MYVCPWERTLLQVGNGASDYRPVSGRELSGHGAAIYHSLSSPLGLGRRSLPDPAAHTSLIPTVTARLPRLLLVMLVRLDLFRSPPWKSVWLRLACRGHVDHESIAAESILQSLCFTTDDICSANTRLARPRRCNSRFCVFARPPMLIGTPFL